MANKQIPGNNHYHKMITPDEVDRLGHTCAINQTLNCVRDHLQVLFGPLDPVGTVHVAITVEPLTDSAGGELMTRED